MCWMCLFDKRIIYSSVHDEALAWTPGWAHVQAASAVAADHIPTDSFSGVWAFKGAATTGRAAYVDKYPQYDTTQPLLLTIDNVPDDTSSTATLVVNGPHVISTIDAIADQDFYRVELEAGTTYEIHQYSAALGPSGIPLPDAYLEIYDASGNLLQSADGGGQTPGGQIYGLDAMLTFTPTVSGTYYVNARSFDNTTADGSDKGDTVGDYEIWVSTSTYVPYYDLESPLHAIDWGTQVNKIHESSRNPDGEEGPRPTGNPYEPVTNEFGITGKNVITVYFAKAGEVYVDDDPTTPGTTETIVAKGFEAWEIEAYQAAFAAYEQVADIVYVVVDNVYDLLTQSATADFTLVTYLGTTGTSIPGIIGTPSLLGRMSPPDTDNEGQTEFNANDKRWTEEGLQPGGFSFTTLIHEFGHGHGLAHPHDTGGRSSVMRGVEQEVDENGLPRLFDYTNGDFDLNQSVYTMMSYEDGWQKSPYGQAATTDPYGWLGSLMAFDIAAIQDKYGVNEEWATGDDIYVLSDVNAPGTFYSCIWDAGGTDAITYDGTRDCNIDLRPATLKYEHGGGGWVSYAWGIFGGFTIANGVTIENARSGSGHDTLTGNDAANRLDGGAGNDMLIGNGGNDMLIGGLGADRLDGGAGADLFVFDAQDSGVGSSRDLIVGFEQGSDRIDLAGAGASRFIGSADFSGVAGQVRSVTFAGSTIIELDRDGDRVADFQIELDQDVQLTLDDFVGLGDANGATNGDDVLNGTAGADVLHGHAGNDVINGLGGNDLLIGGAGADRLTGGSGRDLFVYTSVDDSPLGGADAITDFARRSDRIDLSAIDANSGTAANDAFSFIGKSAFSGQAGELRYANIGNNTIIYGDVDGDGVADLQIVLEDKVNLGSGDFLF